MKRIIFLLVLVVCSVAPGSLFTQEKMQIESQEVSFAISTEAKAKLKTVKTIAIFLEGTDAFLTRLVEDVLAINLTNAGFTVINRERLTKTIGEQVVKKQEGKGGVVNTLEIARIVNADSILVGTLVIEYEVGQPLLLKICSFQLIDIASEETIINILFEFSKGKQFSEIARTFLNILIQKR